MHVIPIIFIVILNLALFSLMTIMILKPTNQVGKFQKRSEDECRGQGMPCRAKAGRVRETI